MASWTLVAERISGNLLLQVVALIEHEVDTGVRCQRPGGDDLVHDAEELIGVGRPNNEVVVGVEA